MRIRSGSRVATRPVSNHASGRASLTWTPASLSSRSWCSTTQRGLAEALGVGLVGDHLGLRHVQAHQLHQARPACWCRCGRRRPRRAPCAGSRRARGRPARCRRGCRWWGCSRQGSLSGADSLASLREVRRRRRGRGAAAASASSCRSYDVERWLPESPRQRCSPRTASTSRSSSSTTGRPTGRARSPTRTPPATPRVRVLHVANGGLGAARNEGLRHVTGDLLGVPRLRRRAARRGALADAGRHARRVGLRLRDRLDRALGGRRPRTSRRGCAGCTASAAWASPPASTPRSSATCSRGTSCSGASFWRDAGPGVARGRAVRGPADDHARLPRRRRFDVVPDVVYHWRIRHDGSSITQQRASVDRPARPWRDQADGAATPCRSTTTPATSAYFVDRVLAGDLHRYFVEIPGASDEWWRLLRRRHPRPVGRPLAGAQRPAAGAPAGRLAGRAGPPCRRRVASCGGSHASTGPRRATATAWSSRPTCSTSPTSTPPRWPSATTSCRRGRGATSRREPEPRDAATSPGLEARRWRSSHLDHRRHVRLASPG